MVVVSCRCDIGIGCDSLVVRSRGALLLLYGFGLLDIPPVGCCIVMLLLCVIDLGTLDLEFPSCVGWL
jgi:hypothetical protein